VGRPGSSELSSASSGQVEGVRQSPGLVRTEATPETTCVLLSQLRALIDDREGHGHP